MIKPKMQKVIIGFIAAIAVLSPRRANAGWLDGISNFLGGVWDGFVGALTAVANAIVDVWNFIMDLLTGGGDQCPPAALYYQNQVGTCWSCDLYETMFDAINDVATNAYEGIAGACIHLLAIALALWILFFTGKYLFSFAERKPEEYLDKLFGILFKAMIVAILLNASAASFSNYIVSPIVVTATDYSLGIMESFTAIKDTAINTGGNLNTSALPTKCTEGEGCEYKTVSCNNNGSCSINDGGMVTLRPEACEKMRESAGDYIPGEGEKIINEQIKNAFMCMINSMHYETAYIIAMANAMLCHSWKAENFMGLRYPNLQMLVTSVCILVAILIICFIYIFKLVDVVLRLGFLLILLPILAVAFVFPVTLDFAKKGFGLLLHIVFTFISLTLVLSLALMLVTIAFVAEGEQDTLISCFNRNDINKMKNLIDFSSLNFLFAIITLAIAIKILGLSEQIAIEFSGVMVGTQIGDKLGATGAKIGALTGQASMRMAKLGGIRAFNGFKEHRRNRKAKKGQNSSHAATRNSYNPASMASSAGSYASNANLQGNQTSNVTNNTNNATSNGSAGNSFAASKIKTGEEYTADMRNQASYLSSNPAVHGVDNERLTSSLDKQQEILQNKIAEAGDTNSADRDAAIADYKKNMASLGAIAIDSYGKGTISHAEYMNIQNACNKAIWDSPDKIIEDATRQKETNV